MPLLKAHAHNDYLHERPLFDALEQGFTSIEADVYLADGNLCVAHDKEQIVPGKTLPSMYLEPLRSRIKANKGHVYGKRTPVILLIDVKSDADPTYLALRDLLKKYADVLTLYKGNRRIDRPINVIISGNLPLDLMKNEKVRYASGDGRLLDLGSGISSSLIPLISGNWQDLFTWRGRGRFPPVEKERLERIVRGAHAERRQVRFWATDVDSPEDQVNLWNALLQANVDLIGTDKLEMLKKFLRDHETDSGTAAPRPYGDPPAKTVCSFGRKG